MLAVLSVTAGVASCTPTDPKATFQDQATCYELVKKEFEKRAKPDSNVTSSIESNATGNGVCYGLFRGKAWNGESLLLINGLTGEDLAEVFTYSQVQYATAGRRAENGQWEKMDDQHQQIEAFINEKMAEK